MEVKEIGSEESTLPAEMLALEGVLESCFMIKSLLCEVSNKEMHPDIFPIYFILIINYLAQTVN